MKKISILIPAYNEEDVLNTLYNRLTKLAGNLKGYSFEFMFVNDGSRDTTLQIIKKLADKDDRVAYLNLSRNFGKEIAMAAGFDHVTGDATVIIDADLQDPPELITEMIKYWEEGYDDVYAKRKNRAGESYLKKITAKIFYRILQKSTSIPLQQDTGDFRLLDKQVIDALKKLRESQRYTKGMFSWAGFNKKELLYDRDPRLAGKTKWNYGKLMNFAVDGITSFTTLPLRISSFIGFIVSLIAFVYLILILIQAMVVGSGVPGYSSLMAVILLLGGLQLLSLGVIGEYVGRIFNETKNRPLYLVEEYHNASLTKKSRR